MIRSIAIAAALSAAAIPMTAAASPAFDEFQAVCWGTNDDYVAALKAADTSGWHETDVTAPDEPGVSVTDKAAREKAVDGGDLPDAADQRGPSPSRRPAMSRSTTCKLSVNTSPTPA